MKQQERLERVTRLTSDLLDGTLPPEGQEELNDLLRGDPDACERYLDLAEAHAALLHDHVGDELLSSLPESAVEGSPSIVPFSSRKAVRPLLAVAAALAFLLVNAWVAFSLSRGESEPQVAGDWIAVVSTSVDATWSEGAGSYAEGEPLAPGAFELESGLVQLEFFSGASVVVEGPARLRLESAWRIECLEGKLKTFVPEPAQGFTIVTPEYQAVDLGTEFALSVSSDGSSEVHVVDGEVRLDSIEGTQLQHLEGGDGVVARNGTLESTEEVGDQFVGREQLQNLATESREPRVKRWRSLREKIAADPDTLVFFDFESQKEWDRHLENRAQGGPGGAIIGARWTEGRWPGKGALEFKRITDRIRLAVPGEFEELTYSAWIRVESFDRWLSSIMLTDGFDEGEVHWQISDGGEMVAGIKTARGPNSTSPPVIRPEDLGDWIHVGTTLSGKTGIVSHYLNGESVLEDHRKDLSVFRVGSAEIGNWSPSEAGNHPIRSLNGRIDEFILMKRALSSEEIAEIYEAGQ